MRPRALSSCAVIVTAICSGLRAEETAPQDPNARKTAFVRAVVRGAGLMPWQKAGPAPEEIAFRDRIEARKTRMLAHARSVKRPALLTAKQFARAKRTIEQTQWGKAWFGQHKQVADYVVAQDDAWIDHMIEERTPWQHYGFTCPNCVGRKSQEGVGGRIVRWSHRRPDVIQCLACGQTYPDPRFPETASLEAPRMGQTLTFYLNERERANPDDRTGKLAYHWVGRPIHVSFSGNVRYHKASFMVGASRSLALVYRFTDDPRYAAKAINILCRLAHCFRNWLYHDYWDTVADCDPLYASWHDRNLKLEWKRHLSTAQYRRDTPDRARMLQNYWGAGRLWPSTGSVSSVDQVCLAYDLTYDARDADGNPLWTDAMRRKVERDLLLEWIIEAEPFVGGEGKATCPNNKAPRVYMSQATVAKTLGVPQLADVALRGYQTVRDRSFTADGFSTESPSYTNMYLGKLLCIPEILHGFSWPSDFKTRTGTVDLYKSDPKLRAMLYGVLDQLRPDGRYAPLSDTSVSARPSPYFFELGLKRYPDHYRGRLPALYAGRTPGEYALFNHELDDLTLDTGFELPEIYYPDWMTAFLRHGRGRQASMVAIPNNPPGGHRHMDNLALFYIDRGQVILGDQGYIGDMPQNAWIRATQSHNLVVVDDKDQTMKGRMPKLHMMLTTPVASAVECSSNAYGACTTYQRLVTMIKGPDAATFLIDVFRVKGGRKRAFRTFSEIAASDAKGGAIGFVGVVVPPEKPLPDFGGSIERTHIYGLRDVRAVERPAPGWQAIWKQSDHSYVQWMLSPVDRLEAANGPGQERYDQLGRRVRYVDAVNEGEKQVSTFVAVHEPGRPDESRSVRRAELLDVPSNAGDAAIAVQVESKWGTYLLLSEFRNPAQVRGVVFQGKFGLVMTGRDGKRTAIGCGASTLKCGDRGFSNQAAYWGGRVVRHSDSVLTTDKPMPSAFSALPDGCQNYVLITCGKSVTGYAVQSLDGDQINVGRFALHGAERFELPALRLVQLTH